MNKLFIVALIAMLVACAFANVREFTVTYDEAQTDFPRADVEEALGMACKVDTTESPVAVKYYVADGKKYTVYVTVADAAVCGEVTLTGATVVAVTDATVPAETCFVTDDLTKIKCGEKCLSKCENGVECTVDADCDSGKCVESSAATDTTPAVKVCSGAAAVSALFALVVAVVAIIF